METTKPIREIFRSYAEFDSEGRHVNGTDKQSNHNYGDAYESLFPDRSEVKLMLEVGVADGSCLLAWRDVFPNALVVGMDIHPAHRLDEPCQVQQRPIEFHIGDQRLKRDCDRAAAGRQFDFICDDAAHHLLDTLLGLYYLWPYVKPGGLYVVEEWEDVAGSRDAICALWPNVEIIDTVGPFGGVEPLVVFRKPK